MKTNDKFLNVANEILNQLGGNKFLAMTGSNNLVGSVDFLRMNLRRNTSGAKFLKITLNSMDTYDMLFFSADRNLNIIVKKEVKGVYCDMLQDIFTKETGLYTKL